jgi:hypothetical protein
LDTALVVHCSDVFANHASTLIARLAFSAVLNIFHGHAIVASMSVHISQTFAQVLFGSYNHDFCTNSFHCVHALFKISHHHFAYFICSFLISQYVFLLNGAASHAQAIARGLYSEKSQTNFAVFHATSGISDIAHHITFLAHTQNDSAHDSILSHIGFSSTGCCGFAHPLSVSNSVMIFKISSSVAHALTICSISESLTNGTHAFTCGTILGCCFFIG